MTSPLPPRLRDTRSLADRSRQDRTNLKQLGVGFVGGRFSPAKPLGATSQFGDLEDDAGDDTIGFLNTDRKVVSGTGNAAMHLTYLPVDGSEHVSWHPADGGGIHLTPADWYRVDQTLTIPTFDGLTTGDVFTCEYAYLLGQEPDPISPFVVASNGPGTYDISGHTLTINLPAGTASGDLLLLGMASYTGSYYDFTIADSRMSLVYLNSVAGAADAGVWIGRADESGSPIVINTVDIPSGARGVWGALASIRGANDFGTPEIKLSAGNIPTVPGVAAVEASWIHAGVPWSLVQPSGYTDIGSSGLNVGVAELGFWFDPDGEVSPSATSIADGYAVIPLI